TQFPMIRAADAADEDGFGTSVAVDGEYAVIGAPGDDDGGAASGSAYVFRRDANVWVQDMKLPPSAPVVGIRPAAVTAGDNFGSAVAISGDHVIVGASLDDDGGTRAGAAYIFRRCGRFESCVQPWSEAAALTADDASEG